MTSAGVSMTASYDGDCACPSESPIVFTCKVTGADGVSWEHPSFGLVAPSVNPGIFTGLFTAILVSTTTDYYLTDFVTILTADSIDSVNGTELVCTGYSPSYFDTARLIMCVKGT